MKVLISSCTDVARTSLVESLQLDKLDDAGYLRITRPVYARDAWCSHAQY